ncbi:MAG: helix-turn-helix transcriptional regulator, partial [bacterium]
MLANKDSTKWEILSELRESSECTVSDLRENAGVSPSTLNEHLSDLEAMNLVDKRSEKHGPGRPRHLYSLTEDAEHLFPNAYAELASMLLEVIESFSDEPEAREKLVEVLTNQLNEYDDLERALRALGFYPDFELDGESETITYQQCPFYEVA